MTATLAGFRAYHGERGSDVPTSASDTAATTALVRAGDYVRNEYAQRFLPQYVDDIADLTENAVYEAALFELATPDFFSATYTEADAKVLVGVGDISWQFTGRNGGNRVPTSTKIEAMMRPYVAGNAKSLLRS